MNVALVGSVSSSWAALEALIEGGVEITGVLGVHETLADRISDYRPIRRLAEKHDVPFCGFERVDESGVAAFLQDRPPDLLWVIGLSQLVPRNVLEIARCGGVGFHPTMLPEGRGRAPVAWTILKNARAAVSLFFLTDEPDAGDLIVQREVPVLPDDYSEDLIARTNDILRRVVLELAPAIKASALPRTPQDHARATHYPRRSPEDGLIHWHESTDQIYRLIRAAGRPYPGAFTHRGKSKMIVWRARPEPSGATPSGRKPGLVVDVDAAGDIVVATGDGLLRLTDVETSEPGERTPPLAPGDVLGPGG